MILLRSHCVDTSRIHILLTKLNELIFFWMVALLLREWEHNGISLWKCFKIVMKIKNCNLIKLNNSHSLELLFFTTHISTHLTTFERYFWVTNFKNRYFTGMMKLATSSRILKEMITAPDLLLPTSCTVFFYYKLLINISTYICFFKIWIVNFDPNEYQNQASFNQSQCHTTPKTWTHRQQWQFKGLRAAPHRSATTTSAFQTYTSMIL